MALLTSGARMFMPIRKTEAERSVASLRPCILLGHSARIQRKTTVFRLVLYSPPFRESGGYRTQPKSEMDFKLSESEVYHILWNTE